VLIKGSPRLIYLYHPTFGLQSVFPISRMVSKGPPNRPLMIHQDFGSRAGLLFMPLVYIDACKGVREKYLPLL
jgi:hypothetical protein